MLRTFETGDGRTLSYQRRGAGPLVVCVPGGPGLDPESYFAGFALPGFEVLVFAPRGTGGSTAPPSVDGYGIAGYVEDVESLRVHLELERLTLLGNSYGGSIVLAYAEAHPEHIARLIISGAAARVDDHYEAVVDQARRRFAETVADGEQRLAAATEADALAEKEHSAAADHRAFREAMACAVAHEGPVEVAYLDRLCSAPKNDRATEQMWVEWREGLDLLARASVVGAPTLVIAGELDVVVPPAAVRLIADALPNARYVEFPRVGHFSGVESSDQFRATVCAFLAGDPG